jgi:hypothetical protein
MKTKTHQADDGAGDAFLAKAAGLWPVAKGSLTQTRSPCTRKNCKQCASGRKHPRLLFTFREEGRLRGMYVRPSQEKQVRQAIANGRELERLMTAAGRDLVLALREEAEA